MNIDQQLWISPNRFFHKTFRALYPLMALSAAACLLANSETPKELTPILVVAYILGAILFISWGYYRRICLAYRIDDSSKLLVKSAFWGTKTFLLSELKGATVDVERYVTGKWNSNRSGVFRVETTTLYFTNGGKAKLYHFTPEIAELSALIQRRGRDAMLVNCSKDIEDSNGLLLQASWNYRITLLAGNIIFSWAGFAATSKHWSEGSYFKIAFILGGALLLLYILIESLFRKVRLSRTGIFFQTWYLKQRQYVWPQLISVTNEGFSFTGAEALKLKFSDDSIWTIPEYLLERDSGVHDYIRKKLEESRR